MLSFRIGDGLMKHLDCVIPSLATALSIISLALVESISICVRIIIGIVGIISFIYLLISEYKKRKPNERHCKSDEEIDQAMKEIIRSQGKICIVSRDLTWVTDEIIGILISKKSSVLIFAQHKNDTTDKLQKNGVRVKFYGKYKFEPKTRFTVIRYNRTNPQVAIANNEDSIRKNKKLKHVIYETSSTGSPQDAWINSLAVDMITLCDLVCMEELDD